VSWDGGGTPTSRLKDWLDPGNTGALTHDGSYPNGVGSLRYDSHASTDACVEPENVNGIWEPGETITLSVAVRAAGGDHTDITGTLTSPTPGVTVVDGSATWPDLANGIIASCDPPYFQLVLDAGMDCLSTVELQLEMSSAEGGPWLIGLSEEVGQSLTPPGLPIGIPDNNATGAESPLPVAEAVVLSDVDVRVQIQHTYVGDLKVWLEHPDGTLVTLLDRPGVPASTYGCGDNDMNVTFDDASGYVLETHCAGSTPWYTGVAGPVGSLASLNGKSSAGEWKLHVSDNAGADTGSIVDWELLTTPPLSGTCTPCAPVVGVPAGSVAAPFGLAAPRPNPFAGRTELRFRLPEGGSARLEIFDVSGRRVRTLVDRALPAGPHTAAWDGRDASGQPVAAGIYFVRLAAGDRRAMQRVSLVR
jgi:subtilisin-like proprotein convertase family protein